MRRIEIVDKLYKIRTVLLKIKYYKGLYNGAEQELSDAEEIIVELAKYEAKLALFDVRVFLKYGITADRIIDIIVAMFLAANIYFLAS